MQPVPGEVIADGSRGCRSWHSHTWEALCVAFVTVFWLPMPFILPFLPVLALYHPSLWMVIVPLVIWTYYDWDAGKKGPRRVFHVHGTAFDRGLMGYYPLRVLRAPGCVLDSSKNYIIDGHPHGFLQLSSFTIAAASGEVAAAFPGITFMPVATKTLFWIPIVRDLFLAFGVIRSTESCMRYVLQHPGQGMALMTMSGATDETSRIRTDMYHLYLKRKGFCKVALQEGASLVPALIFGKNEAYQQPLARYQNWVYRTFGWRVTIPFGRGVFQKYFGLLPHRVPHTYVLGAPIPVQKVASPSKAEIDELHSKHVEALRQLYEEYAPRLQPQRLPLVIEQ